MSDFLLGTKTGDVTSIKRRGASFATNGLPRVVGAVFPRLARATSQGFLWLPVVPWLGYFQWSFLVPLIGGR